MTSRTERLLAWFVPLSAPAIALGILLGRASEQSLPGWIALGCALAAALLLRDRERLAAAVAAVCAIGFVLGQGAYHPALPAEGYYRVCGIVAGEIRQGDFGQVKTELRYVTLDGKPAGNAYWSFYLEDEEPLPSGLEPGVQVSVTAKLYHPEGADNPQGYDFREYLLQQGVTIGVYGREEMQLSAAPFRPDTLAAWLRHRLSEGLTAAMGAEAGGYASAMLLGVKELVPSEDRTAFSRLGIAHVLSISGFHVGVLAALTDWILRRLKRSVLCRALVTSVLLGGYCLLTGAMSPVVRATVICILHQYGMLRHRQRSDLHLLSASFVLILIFQPCQLTSASFQLTYGAMLGLMLITPTLQSLWEPDNRRLNRLWQTLTATAGAQIGVLAPQLYWFGETPVLALVLNMAVFLLTGGLMTLYWLTLALLPFPLLAQAAGAVSAWLTSLMLGAVRWLGQWEYIVLWTKHAGLMTAAGWLLIMVALSWLNVLPSRRRLAAGLAGAALLTVSLIPLPNPHTEYIQFSVGDADAALLRDRDTVVAVDLGEDGYDIAQYLHQRRLGVDMLILTHLHSDHAGGLAALLEDDIPVRRCFLPEGAELSLIEPDVTELLKQLESRGTRLIILSRGDVIPLPSGEITVLWPEKGRVRPGQDANHYSLAMRVRLHETSMLLTGDLSGAYEGYVAVPADILKAAHHGSSSSTLPEFVRQVSPQAVLLSADDDERAAALAARVPDAALYDTGRDGAITIRFTEEGWTVTTFK